MGAWYYDKIKGKGIYISKLRDVYKGMMNNGLYEGFGELLYSDGSKYVGEFLAGKRHGKGIFTEREGSEYYGHFVDDLSHGEHIVKVIIPIEEVGQDSFEIRVGIYDKGELVRWKSKFSNPIATKQFVQLFKQSREMFDSVYSMILAKNLPSLPEGIDANDPKVKQIVFKIRTEAGMLVGQQVLLQAQAKLEQLLKPFGEKTREVEDLKKEIEGISIKMIDMEKEASSYYYQFTNLISKYEKDTMKIEQYWHDEPTEVRRIFREACKKLETISVEEFFAFRNHRIVPIYTKRIMDAISYLLNMSTVWEDQQYIIADSIANSRHGDEEALRLSYHCKLSYLMVDYKVFNYVNVKNKDELENIVYDIRFRHDSYYIESLGKAAPVLVQWVKANYAYIRAAKNMYSVLNAAEAKKMDAFRLKAIHTKKLEEVNEVTKTLDTVRKKLAAATLELEDLQLAVLKANDLLNFITGRFNEGQTLAKDDYYKLLEQKLEEKKDFFVIEVCVQSIVDVVVERAEKKRKEKIFQAMANGVPFEDFDYSQPQILTWLRDEVKAQQSTVLGSGRTLGYSFEPEPTDVSKTYTMQLISLVIDLVVGKFNDRTNDLASARRWVSKKGRRFTSRFLYIFAWKIWEDEAISMRDRDAIIAWEQIFGDTETCAVMAVEAAVNLRMSKVARAQAAVWAKHHPEAIVVAERFLSDTFEVEYVLPEEYLTAENTEEIVIDKAMYARAALQMTQDADNEAITPRQRATCMCWIKLNPEPYRAAQDEQNFYLAQQFEDNFAERSAEVSFKILNGLANDDEMEWAAYAQQWKDFNLEKYDAVYALQINEMSRDFIEAYPLNTFLEAAKMIENDAIAKHVVDKEVQTELVANPRMLLNAFSWGSINQGMLRKAKEMLEKESEESLSRQWRELCLLTDDFKKGSALFASADDKFIGFRARLLNKFAWMHGYLCRQQEVTLMELEALNLKDPLHKVLHRIRPSVENKYVFETEEMFQAECRRLEARLQSIIPKLASINTYFGLTVQQQPQKV